MHLNLHALSCDSSSKLDAHLRVHHPFKMRGLMQKWPLTIPSVLTHAERNHGSQTCVSQTTEGPMHTYTFAELAERSKHALNFVYRF